MKKVVLTVFFVVLALAIFISPAQSFNPAAHVYIADHHFPNQPYKNDLYYGSIAPDMAMYTNEAKWPHSFWDTHHTYINLIPFAQGARQLAFARGWFTHNEENQADRIAHGDYRIGYADGYVTKKANLLLEQLIVILHLTEPYDESYLYFAHFAIEAAIDLLLKEQYDHSIGIKLLLANLFRSPLDRELLTRVLKNETDWVTLLMTELTFRNLVHQYATALSSPKPFEALVKLGVQLAQQQFGITTTPELLSWVLDEAINLCAGDYYHSAIL
ncbi:MAG: hypothetical protein HY787_15795, partial [Deltaproteobacteria bacterium]|nr:hypothetical protein [Deltaproteobacteria bacterium]